jgi:response regulator RpfG family c-di-GMP phosphodiesterase
MSRRRVMLVDDDQRILDAFRRHLRRRFDIVTCSEPERALDLLDTDGPFGAIVSDYRMPCMNGVELLAEVQRRSPMTVRVMLTGQADYEATLAAINEGHIYRFLTKPCPVDTLANTIDDALGLYRLVLAEKELLEGTLHGAVGALTELLGLARPEAQARSSRINNVAVATARRLETGSVWMLETAASLSQIGCMTLDDSVARAGLCGHPMSELDRRMYESHPRTAEGLLARIPRLESIAAMVGAQFNGGLLPARLKKLELDATVVEVFLAAVSFAENEARSDQRTALEMLDDRFSSAVRQALGAAVGAVGSRRLRRISCDVEGLLTGMVAADDIVAVSGILLVSSGHEMTEAMLHRIRNFHRSIGVVEPFEILVPERSN